MTNVSKGSSFYGFLDMSTLKKIICICKGYFLQSFKRCFFSFKYLELWKDMEKLRRELEEKRLDMKAQRDEDSKNGVSLNREADGNRLADVAVGGQDEGRHVNDPDENDAEESGYGHTEDHECESKRYL